MPRWDKENGSNLLGEALVKAFKLLVYATAPLSSNLDRGLIGKYSSSEPDLMCYGCRGGEV